MKNKILLKSIISCLVGAAIWIGFIFIKCMAENKSFTKTFFTTYNIIELVAIMFAAGVGYYLAEKKRNK